MRTADVIHAVTPRLHHGLCFTQQVFEYLHMVQHVVTVVLHVVMDRNLHVVTVVLHVVMDRNLHVVTAVLHVGKRKGGYLFCCVTVQRGFGVHAVNVTRPKRDDERYSVSPELNRTAHRFRSMTQSSEKLTHFLQRPCRFG